MTDRLSLADGAVLLVESSQALPLVHVGVSLRTGTVHDPRGGEGLMRLTVRALRMGTRALPAAQLEEQIDALGAQLGVGAASSYVHVGGSVVAHNLEAFVRLLGELLTRPALRGRDVAQVKRETLAELAAACDDDRSLCARAFRAFAFGAHPYGRPLAGSRRSVAKLSAEQVRGAHAAHFVASNAVVGMAGAVTASRAQELCDRYLRLPRGTAPRVRVPEPRLPRGRRLLLVDKPERTQTQVLIGTLGTHARDPDHTALQVGNTVFGGLFTARLTREVRSKRGFSYGASSSLGHDRQRELWSMWTFPAAKDARECIELQLRLYDDFVRRGVTERELRLSKSYLQKSHAFEIDTAEKRLSHAVELELFELPVDYHSGFPERVREVTLREVNAAVRRRLSRDDLALTVVATAGELRRQLAALPGLRRTTVLPWREV